MNEDEIIAMWESEYRRCADANIPHSVASKTASDEVKRAYQLEDLYSAAALYTRGKGEKTDEALAGQRLVSRIGQRAKKLRAEYKAAAHPNGTHKDATAAATPPSPAKADDEPNGSYQRRLPGLVTHPSGKSNVAQTMLNAIQALPIEPGYVLHLGNLFVLAHVIGCTHVAIVNIMQNVAKYDVMEKAGYKTEIVDKSYTSYAVRFTSVPQTAEQKEAHAIREQIEALLKRLDNLERK